MGGKPVKWLKIAHKLLPFLPKTRTCNIPNFQCACNFAKDKYRKLESYERIAKFHCIEVHYNKVQL